MNDLAELTLRGLAATGRRVARYPLVALSVAGLGTGAVIVWAGGRVGAAPATFPLTSWFGLLPQRDVGTDTVPGALLCGGVVVLILLWLTALRVVRRPACREQHVWQLAAVWAAPFAVGPPLLSSDVYRYAAHGVLGRHGLDPYTHGPAALDQLGDDGMRVVGAVEPALRSAFSTSGPLELLVQQLAVTVSGGTALGAVIALRVLAVAATVAIGLFAAELAGPRRVAALAITVLNPAVLLFVVSGAHLDGVFVALLLAALVARTQRRWVLAVLLTCAAAGLKPIGLIAVVAVLLAHAAGRRTRFSWRALGRDGAVAVLALTACAFAVRNGLGWARNLGNLTREHTPFAPANIIANAIAPVVSPASFDDLAAGGRIAVGLAGLTIVVYLVATVALRPLERTFGYALLTAGLCAPLLFGWFLLWGLLCLAPTARGARRAWVVGLSCAACVLHPAGLPTEAANAVTGAGLLVIATVLAAVLLTQRARSRPVRSAVAHRTT